MTPERTFLAVATVQTVVVAALVGFAAALVPLSPGFGGLTYLAMETSGLGARLTHWTLVLAIVIVAGLYLAIPVAVGAYLARNGSRHWLAYVGLAAASVLALPTAGYLVVRASRSIILAVLLVPVGLLVVVGWTIVGLSVAGRWTDRFETGAAFEGAFFNAVVLGIVVLGLLLGSGVLSSPADRVVERVGMPPLVEFAFAVEATDDGRGVLTIAHSRGDVVRADRLIVGGSGLADVPGADQPPAGPWAGEVTYETAGRPAVGPNNTVTVGVESDCAVRVGYGIRGPGATLDTYTCEW